MKHMITPLVVAALAVTMPAAAQRTASHGVPSPGRTGYSVKAPLQRMPGVGPLAAAGAGAPSRAAAPMRVPGSNVEFTGVMVYSDDWSQGDFHSKVDAQAGVYRVPARADRDWTQLAHGTDWFYTRAAVTVGNTIYAVMATFDGEDIRYMSCSTNSWTLTSHGEVDTWDVPSTLALDPTTGDVYGYFYNESTGDYDRLCTFDLSQGLSVDIATGDPTYALACNSQGELYGVTYSGRLVSIDKATGAQESVGFTGLAPIDRNSMAFDDDGRLYWAATYGSWYTESFSGLFEVNTLTGEVTQLRDFPHNESWAGLTVNPLSIPTTAPAAVTGLGVTFAERGALRGSVAFTAPTTRINGRPLAGAISAIVNVAGRDSVVEGIEPGAAVEMVMDFDMGSHTLRVTTADDNDRGQTASCTFYAGEDLPGTPLAVTLTERDGEPMLTWTPAPTGLNGGLYDTGGVTYTVVRYPGQATVAQGLAATEFTDHTLGDAEGSIYYTVTAVTALGHSDAARSNAYVFGATLTVPFTEPFATQERFDLWTIDDLNGGPTWQWSADGYAYYDYANTNVPADDWIISPKFTLVAGRDYKLSYRVKTRSKTYVENFALALGTAASAGAMTRTLADHQSWASTEWQTLATTFTAENGGTFHLGVHCYSAAQMWQLQITDISLEELTSDTPAPVSDLTVTAAPLGAMSATVRCTAPTTTAGGETLASLTAVKVYRSGTAEAVHTFANPVPGAELEWEDTGIEAAATITWRVVAENEAGESLPATASAFVGVDAPGAPQNLRLTESNGRAVLTWEPPVTGRNGGYFDPTGITYQVWRYSDYTQLADGLAATTFTDATTAAITAQTLIDYVVFPYSGSTRGAYALSNAVIFGTPYAAPLTETFNGDTETGMNYYPWVGESDQTMGQGWTLDAAGTTPQADDHNGDQGMAVFHSRGENAGIHARLSSPKISVTAIAGTPMLSFYMYHSHDDAVTTRESIAVEYSLDGVAFTAVDGATFMRDNGTTGWQRHTVALPAAAGSDRLRVAFVGTTDGAPTTGLDIYIDSVTIGAAAATGDLNGDGRIDIDDLNLLINAMLELPGTEAVEGDLNGDGQVDIDDVNALINIMLQL